MSKQATFPSLMSVMAERDLELHQVDVRTAFLNGVLEEGSERSAACRVSIPQGVWVIRSNCALRKAKCGAALGAPRNQRNADQHVYVLAVIVKLL